MSKAVRKDWNFSDDVFASQSTKNFLEKKYYGSVSIRKASEEEDINNNIDYYIDNIPIQWRTQRFENIKGPMDKYVPTFRYSRMFSSHEERKESEFNKIVRNRKNGLPYPKHHIWCLVNKNYIIKKLFIVDIDTFISDYLNEEYEIWFTRFGKKINNSNTGNIISLRQNYDKSSEFISLNEKYLLPNTILLKYTSN